MVKANIMHDRYTEPYNKKGYTQNISTLTQYTMCTYKMGIFANLTCILIQKLCSILIACLYLVDAVAATADTSVQP